MPITWTIIIITVITSLMSFPSNVQTIDSIRQPHWFDKFKFNAVAVAKHSQIYRLFSYGFVHANWMHLFFNMLTLYFFGGLVENSFKVLFPGFGGIAYVLFYVAAIAISSLHDLIKYNKSAYYNAVGASGAVSAVVFAAILFKPDMKLMFILLPIPITAWIFGLLYLLYSAYMAKRGGDNIGHNAHFWGAVFGFVMPIILEPKLFNHFLNHIL